MVCHNLLSKPPILRTEVWRAGVHRSQWVSMTQKQMCHFVKQGNQSYCWRTKSCTTWDVQNLVNNGIFRISQLVQDFVHQQYLLLIHIIYISTCDHMYVCFFLGPLFAFIWSTLRGTNISHLGKWKVIFKSTFGRGYVGSQEDIWINLLSKTTSLLEKAPPKRCWWSGQLEQIGVSGIKKFGPQQLREVHPLSCHILYIH